MWMSDCRSQMQKEQEADLCLPLAPLLLLPLLGAAMLLLLALEACL